MVKLAHVFEQFAAFALVAAAFSILPPQVSAQLPGSLGRRSEALLGRQVRSVGSSTVPSVDGERVQLVGRAGLIQFSRRSGELDEVIFPERLSVDGIAHSSSVSERSATVGLGLALRRGVFFAARHYRGFKNLHLREERLVNHQTFLEYRFVWQRRKRGAWLPQAVKVGVEGHSGRVAYYWSERSAVKVSLRPKVSAREARLSADHAVKRSAARVGRPVLTVVPTAGRNQRLVWETRVALTPAQRIVVPQVFVVRTDAQTGESSIIASTNGQAGRPPPPSHQAPKLPEASASAAPVYGSCYDAKYWDSLSSRYEASYCAAALTRAGYTPRTYDNTSALNAWLNYPTDAVFYFTGHSLDKYQTPGNPSSPHQAIGLLFEEGGPTGDIDILAENIQEKPQTGVYTICDEKGVCRTQNGAKAYFWDTEPSDYTVNLAVLEGCATASSVFGIGSLAGNLNYWGAGTSIGFVEDILEATADNSAEYGHAWAQTFWNDLGAGATYSTALVDAANSVSGQYGYGSWVQFHRVGTPTTLYPAQYLTNLHGLPLEE